MKASAKLECIKYMMTLKNLFLGSHGQASSRDEMLGPTDEK